MAKDPAFLFYSQDFIVGVQTMTHEDRGKYITILCQMHQQGRLDEETIRFLVGSVSDKLRLKFKVDEKGLWYNERLELETARRNNFTETRRNNGAKGGRPKKEEPKGKAKHNLKVNHMPNHMGNENVIENEDEILNEYENWTQQIIEGNDHHFEQMFMKESIPQGPNIQFWIMDHRDLLSRYPKMRPPNQQAFRQSCIKHIRENYKNEPNGKSKGNSKQQQSAATADYLKDYYSDRANGKQV